MTSNALCSTFEEIRGEMDKRKKRSYFRVLQQTDAQAIADFRQRLSGLEQLKILSSADRVQHVDVPKLFNLMDARQVSTTEQIGRAIGEMSIAHQNTATHNAIQFNAPVYGTVNLPSKMFVLHSFLISNVV